MSRTVNGEKWFGLAEKERLRKLIRRVAGFSGIRVITYAVMDNHFHLLVEVPAERTVSDEELVRRFELLYPEPTPWQPVSPKTLADLLRKDGPEGKLLRQRLTARMHDVSWLMKTIKQRFSKAFNAERQRFGPVWSERFKAVLVEGDLKALRTVAAYIDLNAVRAGKAEDPKDYRFCGYAEAIGGGKAARDGLRTLDESLAGYRQTLFGAGSAPREGKTNLPPERAREVIESEKGELPLHEILRLRVRYFTDGFLLGSPEFVQKHAEILRPGRKTPPKPRHLREAAWSGLAVLNGMRKTAIEDADVVRRR